MRPLPYTQYAHGYSYPIIRRQTRTLILQCNEVNINNIVQEMKTALKIDAVLESAKLRNLTWLVASSVPGRTAHVMRR